MVLNQIIRNSSQSIWLFETVEIIQSIMESVKYFTRENSLDRTKAGWIDSLSKHTFDWLTESHLIDEHEAGNHKHLMFLVL